MYMRMCMCMHMLHVSLSDLAVWMSDLVRQ